MNRLHHLRQTLPVNLLDNAHYNDLEFVILDYNSTDGLEHYIREEMSEFIETQRMVYYKTFEPMYFQRSHSRNMAFKLASGAVICNVDADNFTGADLAMYISQLFQEEHRLCITAIGDPKAKKDILGRICLKRDSFLDVGGYDEDMNGYGFEDHDLVYRLEKAGVKKVRWEEERFLHALSHSDEERIGEEQASKSLRHLFFRYLTPYSSELIFLFDNASFYGGIISDNGFLSTSWRDAMTRGPHKYRHIMDERTLKKGTWEQQGGAIFLNTIGIGVTRLIHDAEIKDRTHINYALLLWAQLDNRNKMERNISGNDPVVNKGQFGQGVVYRNFNTSPFQVV